jgi:hypothetical protein
MKAKVEKIGYTFSGSVRVDFEVPTKDEAITLVKLVEETFRDLKSHWALAKSLNVADLRGFERKFSKSTIAEFAKKYYLPQDVVETIIEEYDGVPKIEQFALVDYEGRIKNFKTEKDLAKALSKMAEDESDNDLWAIIVNGHAVKRYEVSMPRVFDSNSVDLAYCIPRRNKRS